ncbi:ABC transporter permease [Aliiroseovarius lamellibrachiae]|uniref:ABC transporter permease n=1 Tax=Aliiroseovarius lamellibrachiae TaxID=1924933 RepID=UPI001BE124D2|nr:FtsX-like permease family protein [Aliiroseovarius lamellibrachiae]MBT2130548.1 FtsX-like permease family protein [Aliiroseovarius lamellibrachiae]
MSALRQAARFARRDMRGGLRGFRIFLACLALGVAAIAAVGSVRESLQAGLESQGAVLLGGDASVSFTYRFAEEEEAQQLGATAETMSVIADFRSMAVVGEERGLTQVKAVDGQYPLYGQAVLNPPMSLETAFAGQNALPGAVMDDLLMARLGLVPGDRFNLGGASFVLMAELVNEPDNASGGFGLGPRTLVHRAALAGTGLLSEGTLFDSHYRLRLPEDVDLDQEKKRVMDQLETHGARWEDARNGAPGMSRFITRLSTFLVLVGLAGLAVGGVGISAAVRAYLDGKTETIAILRALGAERRVIFLSYFLQIAVLTLAGLLIGLLLGAGLPVILAPWIAGALPIEASISVYPGPLAEAALYGCLAALLFTLWPLAQTEDVQPATLFRDAALGERRLPRPVYIGLSTAILALLVWAAATLSGMATLAMWSFVGIAGAFAALVLTGLGIRYLSRWLGHLNWLRGHPIARMALTAVGGPGGEAGAVVLSLGLGLAVLAAVGQIDNNLRGAISRELPDVAPSFFVVDIQPDQIEGVQARLKGDAGVTRVDTAPMLRGVITQINDRPAAEVAGNHWVVQGDRGLTYSDRPTRTKVVAGRWWPENYDGPPQISFAAEEAEEMGLGLGDIITVNILGRDIAGEITSLREVDFSQAGMGFVLTMNPSALQGAPHTWLATIYADQASEAAILRDLGKAYPNITLISVRDAITRVTGLMGQVAAAITYGAMATLVTGFVVLMGAAAAGERARTYEAAVLKTLGATRGEILLNFALRSAVLGAAAGVVAVIAGGISGWAVTHYIMENDFVFEPVSAIAIVTGGVVATILAGLAYAWRPLAARPAQVLRARE